MRLYDTLWCDCSTAAYDHSDPEEIAQTKGREKKDSERRLGFNQYYRRKQITQGRYNTKHFLAHTPAGAESDLNAAAAAPSQTEVTDLNCSDHSTASKEIAA